MKGKSLIGFDYSSSTSKSFQSFNVLTGKENPELFWCASNDEVDTAILKSQQATQNCAELTGHQKSTFLLALKQNLLGIEEQLAKAYCAESSLSLDRFHVEFNRVLFQLEHFAEVAESSSWQEVAIDTDGSTFDLRKTSIPIGPVVVFGASNFPLAYSTLGGDTVAAMTSGCPVIVKAHPMHPATSSMVADVISTTAKSMQFPDGFFSHLLDDGYQVAEQLLLDERIKAVGFTGSIKGGKALINLSNKREDPIPVFAEMGSVNPIVIMEEQLGKDVQYWSSLIATSISNDAGQFCTKPGLLFVPKGAVGKQFTEELSQQLSAIHPLPMLHPGIYKTFIQRRSEEFGEQSSKPNFVQPIIYIVTASEYIKDASKREEFFGPLSVVVEYESMDELSMLIQMLEGQLTGTIIATENEILQNKIIIQTIKQRVGRLIINGVPTGVKVCAAMNHGGPYPASSDSRFTAVGARSVARFVRPLTYQNAPQSLLPEELKNENSLNIYRRINGHLTKANVLISNF